MVACLDFVGRFQQNLTSFVTNGKKRKSRKLSNSENEIKLSNLSCYCLLSLAHSADRQRGARAGEPAVTDSAARHNAAPRVRLLQGGIRLSRELSGEEPEVQRLSRHASSAAARTRSGRRRAAEWSRRERAPPHDAVCVPLRCLPCSRARQHVRDGFASPCPAIPRERRHRGSRVAATRAAWICAWVLIPRGERMVHGAL